LKSAYQEYLEWTYFSDSAFDRAEFKRLPQLLEGITRFIDVGASHGVYTYHANRILTDADIICIEADPERFSILEENTAKWASESTNRIQCVNAAASDEEDRQKNQQITFYATGTQISGGLFSVAERSDGYRPYTVPLVCVDDYFDPDAKTVVKVDVEGSELRVLKGARRHVASRNAQFFVEISWWGDRARGTTSFDVLRFSYVSGLRIDRRLKSDYLLSPEPSKLARAQSIARCLPPLMVRYAWNRVVPQGVRTWRERRQNRHRLAKYRKPVGEE
jgi:FkbM family methyltransferase